LDRPSRRPWHYATPPPWANLLPVNNQDSTSRTLAARDAGGIGRRPVYRPRPGAGSRAARSFSGQAASALHRHWWQLEPLGDLAMREPAEEDELDRLAFARAAGPASVMLSTKTREAWPVALRQSPLPLRGSCPAGSAPLTSSRHGPGRRIGSRNRPDLLEQPQRVPDGPFFRDPATGDPEYRDGLD
jgi:hypothetical protein